ncbi:hypothetical protein C8Q76DRAFT_763057 [Earliella scabrosa]|nr:hypothetical protein C8Q76DRAFT_763057 [Earliella scabrosa]
MSSAAQTSGRDTLASRLSSTFWLLLNTPMIPPEDRPESKAVPLMDMPSRGQRQSREDSRQSMESDATSLSGASTSDTHSTNSS